MAADAAGIWGTPPAGGDGEFYAAARLHLIRPLRGHLPLKGKAWRRAIQRREAFKGKAFSPTGGTGEFYAAARLHLTGKKR